MPNDDDDDTAWLRAAGFLDAALVGAGGEARVYGISADEIVRLTRPGATREDVHDRKALLAEIARGAEGCDFRTPDVVSVIETRGRLATVERRIPGRPLDEVLAETGRPARDTMVTAWLDAAHRIGSIDLRRRGYGDLFGDRGDGSPSFHDYWERRLRTSLSARGDVYRDVDVAGIARGIPEPERPELVHLDVFGGNLLWNGDRVSGVLDFGYSTIAGDGRLNALFAAVFGLSTPRSAAPGDAAGIRAWLAAHDLDAYLPAARRMVAAYWSFVDDDKPLEAWCREVLLPHRTASGGGGT